MSKNLSLKLREDIFEDTENIRKHVKMPRNAYINRALEFFNKMQRRKTLKSRLAQESKSVSKESLIVLEEFEKLRET